MNTIAKWFYANLKEIKLSIFLFLIIFAPPLFQGINLIFILTAYSLCVLIINRRNIFQIVKLKRYTVLFIVLFYITSIYIFLSMFIGFYANPVNIDNYLKTSYKLFLAGVILPINLFYVIYYIKVNGLNFWNFIKALIFAGLIEACFVILMLIFPQVRMFLLNIMFTNNNIDVSSIPFWELNRRYNAFSDSVLDTFGLGMGIISVLPLCLFLYNKSKLIFLVPVFIIVSVFNSVTGILIFIIGFIPLVPALIKKINGIKYGRSISLIFLTALGSGVVALLVFMPEKLDWTIRELKALSTLGFATQGQITSFSLIFRPTFWQLPADTIGLIFGNGHTLYQVDGYSHSDIGYINNIWLAGFFGCFMLYGSFVFLFISAAKSLKDKLARFLIIFSAIAFFVFEIKGYGIGYNPGFAVIMLLNFVSMNLLTREALLCQKN